MRIVRVVGRNGVTYEVPMTAEQAAFFLRLAEFKAAADPGITVGDVIDDWRQKQHHASHSPGSQREMRSA